MSNAYTKILITGGTGFIGSHLTNELRSDNKVIVLQRDVIPSTWLSIALEGCTLIHGDVQNQKLLRRILSDYQIEKVYHLAASAIVSAAVNDPVSTFETNVMGTASLLEAIRQVDRDIPVIVQSTDKVYGNKLEAKEDDALVPGGIYETSKVAEDLCAQTYMETYGMQNIKIARPCNTYGYDLSPRIIPNTLKQCFLGKPPAIYMEGRTTTRQYIYVDDLVNALKFIMEQKGDVKAIYNIGTDDILTQEQVVKTICNFFPVSPQYLKREKQISEIQQQSLDWTRIKKLGWTPKYKFHEGIEKTISLFELYGW